MMSTDVLPWLLASVPLIGALITASAWSKPEIVKQVLLWTTVATWGTVVFAALLMGAPPHVPFLLLAPIAAFAALLSQPPHRDLRVSWVVTVILLGLAMAAMGSPSSLRYGFISLLLLLLLGTLWRLGQATGPQASLAWGLITYGIGAVAAIVAAVAPPSTRWWAGLLTSLVLIPALPFQMGFFLSFTRLPGSLPATLALLLPMVGFSALLPVLPALSESTLALLLWAALTGMTLATLRASAQTRPLPLLAHGALAFYSIFWWFVGVGGSVGSPAAVFVTAVGACLAGLSLGWYVVRIRYGDLDLRALTGLVQPMPRFAWLFSLLALAALGLPPFGIFSGLMGMLLMPEMPVPLSFTLVALAWLAASWYFLDLIRRLLFGPFRPDLPYEDLRSRESWALVLLLTVLTLLGVMPSRWFDVSRTNAPSSPYVEQASWTR